MKLKTELKDIYVNASVTIVDFVDSLANYLHEDEIVDLILELYHCQLSKKNQTVLNREIKKLDRI